MGDRTVQSDSAESTALALQRLTPRQRQCLELVATGLSTKAIATQLGLEPGSVDTYIAAGVKALGARGRYHAADLLRAAARNSEPQNLALSMPPRHPLDLLPYRRKGAIGNDQPVLIRLVWISILAFGFATAFGLFAIGAHILSDFIRAIAG